MRSDATARLYVQRPSGPRLVELFLAQGALHVRLDLLEVALDLALQLLARALDLVRFVAGQVALHLVRLALDLVRQLSHRSPPCVLMRTPRRDRPRTRAIPCPVEIRRTML